MSLATITNISHPLAGLLFLALAVFFLRPWKDGAYSALFIVASLVTAAWHLLAPGISESQIPDGRQQVLTALHYAFWIFALLATLQMTVQDERFRKQVAPLFGVLILLFILAGVLSPYLLHERGWQNASRLITWSNLLLGILGLIVVEQLFRNTNTRYSPAITFLCLGTGLLFVFGIVSYSQLALLNQFGEENGAARSISNVIAAVLLIFATNQGPQKSSVTVSRSMVFYSTSLICAGLFLLIMAASSYYARRYGGDWGNALQLSMFFGGILAVASIFASSRRRASMRVFINKHFFMHKYDYRTEWLNLINVLSQSTDDKDARDIALEAAVSVFHAESAALWLRDERNYSYVAHRGPELADMPKVRADSDFCELLASEWVFHPAGRSRSNQLHNVSMPAWIHDYKNIWIIFPLLAEQRLIGFIALCRTQNINALNWEDLDVIKTVGRQMGSYLALNSAANQLAESKQFDTYNKLTAFIMHDLKNLIAQQALVVENAKKHKENPAFVEDAIRTIENSVARMNTLLSKMQQKGPSSSRSLDLAQILVEAVSKCRNKRPAPSLRMHDKTLWVAGDHDHLVMILSHIIKNAQEATPANGFVDIYVETEPQRVAIIVEDNGQGMDDGFIRERLFRPFDTTKSGQGMGIGVFQTREYIRSLGGDVKVHSVVGSGTTFTISMPMVEEQVAHAG